MDQGTAASDSRPTMRSLREGQREERAALILGAAQEVFADKGYHAASIDEIAARAGIAKGTVYLHFASKVDLLVALVEQQIHAFLATVAQVTSEPRPVRARLELILRYVYGRMQEQQTQVLLELNTRIGLTSTVIEKRVEIQAHIGLAMERIAALLEDGKRSGELDRTVPTPVMVATFVTLVSPSGYEHLLRSGQVTSAELASYVSGTFFPSLAAPSAPES